MSKVPTLLKYKVKLFFAPSYRGRFGPLPLLVLMLLFVPSGFGMGFGIGTLLETLEGDQVTETLGSLLSAGLVFAFVFSLGVGITAQPSELDFLMTSPIKSREYLAADLLFQLTTILLSGGVAMIAALFGLLMGMEAPLSRALPLILVIAPFGLMVELMVQSITIARIRYPKARVRQITLLLILLCIVTTLPSFGASLGIKVSDLPIPQMAYADILGGAIYDTSIELSSIVVAGAYFVVIAALWFGLSRKYFFYGVKPTLSGGFGQVDMGTKMAQQRRMISLFGGLTDKIGLKAERGSDSSLMTRLSLVRIWRDGSIIFVILLTGLFLGSGAWSSTEGDTSGLAINTMQGAAWPIAILALNWCYYERANLWIPVVGGRSLVLYFRGLMNSFVIIGTAMSAVMIFILFLARLPLAMTDAAFIILAPIADSVVATLLLTRVKVKPGAFSPGLLAVLFVTFIAGTGVAFVGGLLVGSVGNDTSALVAAQAAVIATFAIVTYSIGGKAVQSLSKTLRFQ